MMRNILGVLVLALAATGCAVDRSSLATPEALRDLEVPEVTTTDVCADVSEEAGMDAPVEDEMTFDAAEDVLEDDVDYFACVVTSKGVIELTLFDDAAPETVNNFVFLAQEGFYDGVVFHRVIDGFMIQTGDRNGFVAGRPGTGNPGYQWADEQAALALPHNSPGVLSMANAGSDTNGSQFFITHVETPHLNGLHAVFGQVSGEGGQDVVDAIEQGDFIRTVEIITQPA